MYFTCVNISALGRVMSNQSKCKNFGRNKVILVRGNADTGVG